MPKINDHDSRMTPHQMELHGVRALLKSTDHRQVDVIYLADLIRDYEGQPYVLGLGWQLSRATVIRIKAMLEGAGNEP